MSPDDWVCPLCGSGEIMMLSHSDINDVSSKPPFFWNLWCGGCYHDFHDVEEPLGDEAELYRRLDVSLKEKE